MKYVWTIAAFAIALTAAIKIEAWRAEEHQACDNTCENRGHTDYILDINGCYCVVGKGMFRVELD